MSKAEAARRVQQAVEEEARPRGGADLLGQLQETQAPYVEVPSGSTMTGAEFCPLPKAVLERYSSASSVCRCGLLPKIGRAWASVDNALFLWRPGEANAVEEEWSMEQAIVAVGEVSSPKQNTFLPTIKHLLVVCTPVEAALVGVCVQGNGESIRLQEMPAYTCPTDNIVPRCVSEANGGRILFGGDDGALHELRYDGRARRGRRVRRVGASFSIRRVLPAALATIAKADPIRQVVSDFDRKVAYALSEGGVISVHDLGGDGLQPVRKISEEHPSKRPPVSISPVKPTESQALCLVGLCADGRRVYYAPLHGSSSRPFGIKLRLERQPPPNPGSPSRPLRSDGSLGCEGCMLVMDGSVDERDGRIVLCSKEHGTRGIGGGRGYREAVEALALRGRGMGVVVEENADDRRECLERANMAGSILGRGELAAQMVAPPRLFATMTTAGTARVRLKRPVDAIMAALEADDGGKSLSDCFNFFGAPEACAMCAAISWGCFQEAGYRLRQAADRALKDKSLAGEPSFSVADGYGAGSTMGQAVAAPRVGFSARHDGLYLLAARALRPTWLERIAAAGVDGLVVGTRTDHLEAVERLLGPAERAAKAVAEDEKPENAPDQTREAEAESVRGLAGMLERAREATALLLTLGKEAGGRVSEGLSSSERKHLESARFSDLASSESGTELAGMMISAAVGARAKDGSHSRLASELSRVCPTFFGERQRRFFDARAKLSQAVSSSSTDTKKANSDAALEDLISSPGSISDLEAVLAEFARAENFQALARLPSAFAAAASSRDDKDKALNAAATAARILAGERREGPLASSLDHFSRPDRSAALEQMLQACAAERNADLEGCVGSALAEAGMGQMAVEFLRASTLERRLAHEGGEGRLRAGLEIDAGQAAKLKLAAECRRRAGKLAESAELWARLGKRANAGLAEARHCLDRAAVVARAGGLAEEAAQLEGELTACEIQSSLASQLTNDGHDLGDLAERVLGLQVSLLSLSLLSLSLSISIYLSHICPIDWRVECRNCWTGLHSRCGNGSTAC